MAGGSSSKKRVRRKRKPNPATQLTDDLLVEILSRVPYRSLCRFRCVSTRWRAIISHPDYRRSLPQTLAGILYRRRPAVGSSESTPVRCCFTDVSGTGRPLIDPSFPFLPDREREHLDLVDSCNGLLLCHSFRNADEGLFDYLVFNPATENWAAVPVSWGWSNKVQTVRLGFDPAFSSHFYIFEFQLDVDDEDYDAGGGHVLGVKIYTSETGVWCHKKSAWSFEFIPQCEFKSVFVNGVLYVIAIECVIGAVDVKGETWRIIDFPRSEDSPFHDTGPGFIDLSQGRLHLANDDDMVGDKLAIWVLEDKDTDEWTLKHTVYYKHLVGRKYVHFGFHEFIVVAIHPDRNMVFFVFGRHEKTLMSYDMDSGRVHVIRNLGHIDSDSEYFLPYVPLFSKSLPDAAKQ